MQTCSFSRKEGAANAWNDLLANGARRPLAEAGKGFRRWGFALDVTDQHLLKAAGQLLELNPKVFVFGTFSSMKSTISRRSPQIVFNVKAVFIWMPIFMMSTNHQVWVHAQEFKIESQVYCENQTTPVNSTVTLFQDKLVFDLSIDGTTADVSEVVIYDSRNQSFELLDVAKERRLHLEQFELVRLLENLRQQGSQDERLTNLIAPKMQEQIESSTNVIKLHNDQIQYEAWCEKPNDATILAIYFEFLDQYTRLAVTDPRRLPPFARLELNQAMKKYGWMPREIKMQLNGGELSHKNVKLNSKHQIVWQLSEQDKKRIELARKQWTQFKQVSLSEYRDLPAVSSQTEESGNIRQ